MTPVNYLSIPPRQVMHFKFIQMVDLQISVYYTNYKQEGLNMTLIVSAILNSHVTVIYLRFTKSVNF